MSFCKSSKNSWKKVRLDSCFDIQQGKQVSKKNRIGDNQHDFLRTANVFWGRLDLTKLDQMHFTVAEEKKFRLEPEDLLVCEGGDIGRTAIWSNELLNCYYQNHLHRLRKKSEHVDPHFVLFWLQYSFLYSKIYAGRANITTIPNLSKSRLAELEILLPSLYEQKRIARILSMVQDAIAAQEELLTKLKEFKQSMMQHLFTRGTKGEKTKMTEIGQIPESWKVVELGSICKFLYGKNLPQKTREQGSFPVYGSNGIVGYHNQSLVEPTGIIIGRKGSAGLVHFSSKPFWPIDTTFYITQNESSVKINYLFYLLSYIDLTKLKADVGVPGINREVAYRELIAISQDNIEQVRITEIIDVIKAKIDLCENKLFAYQSLFRTLLKELMQEGE